MIKKWWVLCSLLVLLVSCASTNKKSSEELKRLTALKEYSKAVKLVESDKFYPEERSKLLKYLESGTLYYLAQDYYQALNAFDKAQELSDKLFTVSISKKVSSTVLSDNLDNYYGEKYERSLIRFFQALVHYKIYQIGFYEAFEIEHKEDKKKNKKIAKKELSEGEKRGHLMGARASILEWDSLLSNYRSETLGENVYKMDLMAKLYGAMIHEEIGSSAEKQIARQLYNDAKDVLFKYYNLYPSFNKKHKKFSDNFEKLANLSRKKVEKDYIEPTVYAKNLTAFIDERLNDLRNGNKDNIKLIVLKDFVAEKKAKKIEFPLPMSKLSVSASTTSVRANSNQKTEIMSITNFTLFVLSISSAATPLIDFELPMVEKKTTTGELFAVVLDKEGKEILRKRVALVNPISDLAFTTMDNKVNGTYARIGARIALKHIAAILAAYTVYKSNPNIIGQGLGLASYIGASKAIAKSEEADLRFWSTLPSSLRMSSFRLEPGTYSLVIEELQGEKKTQYPQGKIKVEPRKNVVLDIKI